MKGYKGFNSDLTCRGFQYKIGETFTTDEPISLCYKGYHFCTSLRDTFQYYVPDGDNVFCEIEASGEIQEGDDKCVCSEIKIIKKIPDLTVNRVRYGYGYGDGYGFGDGYGYGYGYGYGGGYGGGFGYGYGNGDGDGDGYGYGDGDGDGYGYGGGYGFGYGGGGGFGYGYGNGDGYGGGYGGGYGYGKNIHKSIILK